MKAARKPQPIRAPREHARLVQAISEDSEQLSFRARLALITLSGTLRRIEQLARRGRRRKAVQR